MLVQMRMGESENEREKAEGKEREDKRMSERTGEKCASYDTSTRNTRWVRDSDNNFSI